MPVRAFIPPLVASLLVASLLVALLLVALLLVALLMAGAALCAPLSTSSEIQSAIIGNTISGEMDGGPYIEYLEPNGQIQGENAQGRYKGQWRIDGSRLCFHYDEDKLHYWDCVRAELEGDAIIWTDPDGEKTRSKLKPGKPGGW